MTIKCRIIRLFTTSVFTLQAAAFAWVTVTINQETLAATTDRYFLIGDPANDSAWSNTSGGTNGAGVPGDTCDVFFDASGNNAFLGGLTCKSLTVVSGYTAAWGNNGSAVDVAGPITADFGGTVGISGTFTQSAVGNAHFNSTGAATITANLVLSGTGSENLDMDKASWRWVNVTIGAGLTVTNTGAGGASGCSGVLTVNGALVLNTDFRIQNVAQTTPLVIGGSGSISGAAGINLTVVNTADLTITLPVLSIGAANLTIKPTGSATKTLEVDLGGAITTTGNIIIDKTSNTIFVFDTKNYAISAGTLYHGSEAGSNGASTFKWGSSAITLTGGFDETTYNTVGAAGTNANQMGTSAWNVRGTTKLGSTHTHDLTGGTSTLTFTTNSFTYTTAGLRFATNLVLNGAAKTYTISGALVTGSLTVTAGGLTTSNNAVTYSGDCLLGGAGTINLGTSTLTSSGAGTTRISTSGTRTTSGATFDLSAANASLDLCNGANTTMSRLVLGAYTYTWTTNTSTTITISSYTSTDWNSSIWVSSSPSSQYKISAPASVVVSGINVTDCNNVGTTITASGTNGGNNVGWLFGSSKACLSIKWESDREE